MHQSSSFFLHAKCVSQARHAFVVGECTPQASFWVDGDDAYFSSWVFQVCLLDYASKWEETIIKIHLILLTDLNKDRMIRNKWQRKHNQHQLQTSDTQIKHKELKFSLFFQLDWICWQKSKVKYKQVKGDLSVIFDGKQTKCTHVLHISLRGGSSRKIG